MKMEKEEGNFTVEKPNTLPQPKHEETVRQIPVKERPTKQLTPKSSKPRQV